MKHHPRTLLKKIWHFIWDDDSIWSWLVNVLLAFVLIKFIVYPGLGFLLQTSHPVVAVVSESMEHNSNFQTWWEHSKGWYEQNTITYAQFKTFPFKNGFNKGDIMVLKGKKARDIAVGDIIVFVSGKPDPIIHRVVKKTQTGDSYVFTTKGDNYKTNPFPIGSQKGPFTSTIGEIDETNILESQIIGAAVFRIPYLGYIKIGFVNMICFEPVQRTLGVVVKRLPCR